MLLNGSYKFGTVVLCSLGCFCCLFLSNTGLRKVIEIGSEIACISKLDLSRIEDEGLRKAVEMGSEIACIPKLDFSEIEAEGTAAWVALQDQVMSAVQTYGCFEVVYQMVTSELTDALFDRAMPELFGLPLDTKKLIKADYMYDGYAGQTPERLFETFPVREVEKFTRVLWPQVNDTFRDTVSAYLKHLKVLEKIIVRMVFLGLGIENYYESYVESANYVIQLTRYEIPLDKENKIVLEKHLDDNLITILQQHLVEGLEIQTKGGEWIRLLSLPNTFTIIIGEAFQAWTNGRLPSPYHHVKLLDNVKRYAVALASTPKDGCIVQAPKELVDEEHPLVYKPYTRMDYLLYHYSGEEGRHDNTLYDFCGIREEEMKPEV